MPCGAGTTRTALAALRTRLGLGRDNLLLGNLRLDSDPALRSPCSTCSIGSVSKIHLMNSVRAWAIGSTFMSRSAWIDARPSPARPNCPQTAAVTLLCPVRNFAEPSKTITSCHRLARH